MVISPKLDASGKGYLVPCSGLKPLNYPDDEAHGRYLEQKQRRKETRRKAKQLQGNWARSQHWDEQISQLMVPSDCFAGNYVQGGIVLKLIDNAAGICAARHCRTNVVTAGMDLFDYMDTIHNGDHLIIQARSTYASRKSLEVEIIVQVEDLQRGTTKLVVHGYLVFVSLDKQGKTQDIPPLPRVEDLTKEKRRQREEAHRRYIERKEKRFS